MVLASRAMRKSHKLDSFLRGHGRGFFCFRCKGEKEEIEYDYQDPIYIREAEEYFKELEKYNKRQKRCYKEKKVTFNSIGGPVEIKMQGAKE